MCLSSTWTRSSLPSINTRRSCAAIFAEEVERQIAKEVGEYVTSFDAAAAVARASATEKMLEATGVKPRKDGAPTAGG